MSVDSKGLNQINWEPVEFCQVARQNLGRNQKRIGRQGEFEGFCGRFSVTAKKNSSYKCPRPILKVYIYIEKSVRCLESNGLKSCAERPRFSFL